MIPDFPATVKSIATVQRFGPTVRAMIQSPRTYINPIPQKQERKEAVMTKITKRPSTYLYPVPVVLATCGSEKPNIITLAWVGTVCSDPPMVGIGVRPQRHSHSLIEETGEFVINIPSEDLLEITDRCGHVSGSDVDKFAALGVTPESASVVKTPLIAECPVNLECKVVQKISLGAHDLFLGEIVAVHVDETVLDEKGRRIDYGKAKPFVLTHAEYRGLGEAIGTYGYSVKR
jgi:flavin reductase (DIM6/NTAB) family NADH-FMN oxidoreductase RutF